MPWSRPLLQDLIDRDVADIATRMPGADATLRRSNLNVLARVHAGAMHELYGGLSWLANQILPDTCDPDILMRQANIYLQVPQKPATFAQGPVTLVGASGYTLPAGTLLQRSDGAEYTVDADAAVSGGSVTANITAVIAGSAGNSISGTQLSLVSPVDGISSTGTVGASGLANGFDVETTDSIRARLITRLKQPAQGGAAYDYENWATSVAGVTRAWCMPAYLGVGTVAVFIVTDNAPGGPIPSAQTVAAVQAYIAGQCSVIAQGGLSVFAPVAAPLNFTIQLTPNTATVQAAVEAELADLLTRESIPAGTLLLSHIRQAISLASGETDNVLLEPTANVVAPAGQMTTMGVITWA